MTRELNRGGDPALDHIHNEVITDNCYAFDRLKRDGLECRMAVDLGASFGPATRWIVDTWPECFVTSVEGDQKRYRLLVENLQDAVSRTRLLHGVVIGSNRQHIGWDGNWRRDSDEVLNYALNMGSRVMRPVDVVPPGCDLLKIDVEGFEWGILEDLRDADLLPTTIIGEWHFENCRAAIREILEPTHDVKLLDTEYPWGPLTATRRRA
jgi:FkbM family methyltransferase